MPIILCKECLYPLAPYTSGKRCSLKHCVYNKENKDMEDKTLIPASEARRIVENGENEKSLKIWNEVVKEINKAIIIGKCECSVDGCSLPASVIKKLQELGYKAENGSQYNEPFYIIRW